jgi:4a-hydroxytetrahydrobiopterin dehydratase
MSVRAAKIVVMDERDILSRTEISAAVTGLGWRLLLGAVRTGVRTGSLAAAAQVAERAIATAGDGAGESLRADLRGARVILTLQSLADGRVTGREIDLARRISAAVAELGLTTDPDVDGGPRSAQLLEIGIDALDMAAIRPFWRALLGYIDEPGEDPPNGLADPLGQGPSIWFQQMDAPRPQRNRIHFDISVPHDEAPGRIEAALAAGGRLLYDEEAPAFWVLADPEGNEACICTWQGRDT